uniref:Basic leucine zipper transcriptional factor ATF-like n=1 Tax=Amphiprion ocellaris TaxID=80972 RepID=A0AAQ6A4R8_AMPOC
NCVIFLEFTRLPYWASTFHQTCDFQSNATYPDSYQKPHQIELIRQTASLTVDVCQRERERERKRRRSDRKGKKRGKKDSHYSLSGKPSSSQHPFCYRDSRSFFSLSLSHIHTHTHTHTHTLLHRTAHTLKKHKAEVDKDTEFQSPRLAMAQGSDSNDTSYKSPSPGSRPESENLEKENAALRKEVKQLTEEAKYLSSVLSSHEPLCTGLAPQTPDLLYPPHHSSYHHQHIAVPHYQH